VEPRIGQLRGLLELAATDHQASSVRRVTPGQPETAAIALLRTLLWSPLTQATRRICAVQIKDQPFVRHSFQGVVPWMLVPRHRSSSTRALNSGRDEILPAEVVESFLSSLG